MIPNLLTAFYGQVWAILPEKLREIESLLLLRARGGHVPPEQVAAIAAARRADGVQMYGRAAVVPVFGVLAQRVGMMEEASGGIGCEALGATLDGLAADKGVRCIVMAFDSPGGSVFGVQELGAKISAIAKEKKIVAVADSVAASAAYWLASQCSELCVTPGGQIGSIGVISMHQDYSAALEAEGVKTTIVTSSPYKAEGHPEAPLSEEARAELLSKVMHYDALFTKAIAKGRGTTEARVRADFGQGRMVTAQDAVARGMADRVATLEQVLRGVGASSDGVRGEGAGVRLAAARARAVEVEG